MLAVILRLKCFDAQTGILGQISVRVWCRVRTHQIFFLDENVDAFLKRKRFSNVEITAAIVATYANSLDIGLESTGQLSDHFRHQSFLVER